MKPTIVFETDRFSRTLDKWLAQTRKDRNEAATVQFRGVARNLFRITPPMQMAWKDGAALSEGEFKEGFDKGRSAKKSDLNRAFAVPTSKQGRYLLKKHPDTRANLSWYLSARNARKRINGKPKVPIAAGALKEIRDYVFKTQGVTASGWMPIAQQLGVRGIPKWVSEWKGRGWAQFTAREDAIFFHAINRTRHTDSRRIQQSITIAFNRQAGVMERQLKAMAEKAAAKAGVTK